MKPLAVCFALATLAAPGAASAHTEPRPIEGVVSELPRGPLKDRLLALRSSAKAGNVPEDRFEPAVRHALRAMERGRGARAAGDVRHAAMLDALANEWLHVGELAVRAHIAEHAATAAEKVAGSHGAALERARTLLEENQARLGRLEAAWKQAQARDAAKAAFAEHAPVGTAPKGRAVPGKGVPPQGAPAKRPAPKQGGAP